MHESVCVWGIIADGSAAAGVCSYRAGVAGAPFKWMGFPPEIALGR